jgi:hypothetical protein
VVCRSTASLYALREWLRTTRKTWVRRRLPSGRARGASAEIDLGLFARAALQAAEGQLRRLLELTQEAAHAVVAGAEAVLGRQVLVDALRRQAQVELGLDGVTPRLAVTGPADGLAFGSWRRGRAVALGRAGGRNGWF